MFGYADMSYVSGAALAPDGKLVVNGLHRDVRHDGL